MNKITVYSRLNCGNCEAIKSKLKESGISFDEIEDEDKLMEVAQKSFIMSAPIVEIDGEYFAGIDGLKKLGLI